jgi:hypothetical protein
MDEALRVGLMLLPDNLEVDPGFVDFAHRQGVHALHGNNADGVRLWAKHFSPWVNYKESMYLSPGVTFSLFPVQSFQVRMGQILIGV